MGFAISFQTDRPGQWEEILEGLGRGETGALLQDRMDAFDEAVAEQLENLLEIWSGDYLLIEGYRRQGKRFEVEFVGAPQSQAQAFASDLAALLEACGVRQLQGRLEDWSGD